MTLLWLPKHRDIIVPLSARAGVRGWYKIEAMKPDGRRRLLADWFPNLITTLGANQLGNSSPLNFCCVGSGNTPPALGNTTLQALVASTNAQNAGFPQRTAQAAPPYFGSTVNQYNFPAGTATGNLSEVGVGNTATALFSRALILDGGSNPTTITVLSNEALFVTYQLNQYVPTVDVTGSVTIAGVNYNYTLRAANSTTVQWAYSNADAGGINSAQITNGVIAAVTGSPSGAAASSDSNANNGYSVGSFTLSGIATWGLSRNVAGGASAAFVGFGTVSQSRGAYQVGFSAPIPKDGSHVLTLSFSTSWAINTP